MNFGFFFLPQNVHFSIILSIQNTKKKKNSIPASQNDRFETFETHCIHLKVYVSIIYITLVTDISNILVNITWLGVYMCVCVWMFRLCPTVTYIYIYMYNVGNEYWYILVKINWLGIYVCVWMNVPTVVDRCRPLPTVTVERNGWKTSYFSLTAVKKFHF